jgi:hypothetical protein
MTSRRRLLAFQVRRRLARLDATISQHDASGEDYVEPTLAAARDRRLWCLAAIIVWGILVPLARAADVVPPRPLPHAPSGGTLTIGYMRETSSPDGFQAVGTFDRMYFFTGNETLVAIGNDGLYDPAESLAYAYEVLDEGKRYRFHLRQGVQFHGGLGEMSAADVAWSEPYPSTGYWLALVG